MSSHKLLAVGCTALVLAGGAGLANSAYASGDYSVGQDAGFEDDAFYRCITDAAEVSPSTVLTDEQLAAIEIVECPGDMYEDGAPHYATLAGIEKLTGLKTLDLSGHSIGGNIDLSSNTALIGLYLENNEIEGIDLDSNTELKFLDVSENNLRELTVSENTKLETLHAKDAGSFLSIDVSYNPQLKDLYLDSQVRVEAGLQGAVDSATGKITYDYSQLGFLQYNHDSFTYHKIEDLGYFTLDEENYKFSFANQDELDECGEAISVDVDAEDGNSYTYQLMIADTYYLNLYYIFPDGYQYDDGTAEGSFYLVHVDPIRSGDHYEYTLPDGYSLLGSDRASYLQSALQYMKKSGYKFMGWTDEYEGKTVKYKVGDKVSAPLYWQDGEAKTVYALWQKDGGGGNSGKKGEKNPNTADDGIAVPVVAVALAIGGVVFGAVKFGRRR